MTRNNNSNMMMMMIIMTMMMMIIIIIIIIIMHTRPSVHSEELQPKKVGLLKRNTVDLEE